VCDYLITVNKQVHSVSVKYCIKCTITGETALFQGTKTESYFQLVSVLKVIQ